jgi:hypothetical protein
MSPTGASNMMAWRNNLISLVRSSGFAAHLDDKVRPASQEQANLEKHAKDQASAVMATVRNLEDTNLR